MNAGLIAETDLWELSISSSGSLSDTGDVTLQVIYNSVALTRYQTTMGTVTGIDLSLQTINPTPAHSARLQIPALGVDFTVSDNSLVFSQTAKLEIEGLKVYTIESGVGTPTYGIVWDEMRFYWKGGLELTIPGGTLAGSMLTPTSIPLFGEPAFISSNCGPGIPPWNNWQVLQFTDSIVLSGQLSTTGGWRYKDAAGNWVSWPVELPNIPGTPGGGPFSPAFGPAEFNQTTASATVVSSFIHNEIGTVDGPFQCEECLPGYTLTRPGEYRISRAFLNYDRKTSSVQLVPNIPRSVERLNSDYMAVILRGGFPYADARSTAEWYTFDRPTVCGDFINASDFKISDARNNQPHTGFLGTVTNEKHIIEAPLDAPVFAPFLRTHDKREVQNAIYLLGPDLGLCEEPTGHFPTNVLACCPEEPHYSHQAHFTQIFPVTGPRPPTGYSALTSDDDRTRYLNFCGNPHWSYFYYFPDEDDPIHWFAQGAKQSTELYWMAIRQQWAWHQQLPIADRKRTRNLLVSPPLLTGAFANWIRAVYTGVPTSWWGICRPNVLPPNYPTPSLDLDSASEPNWSATDATLTFNAGDITVNPSALTCRVTLDLSSFTDPPYWAAIPTRFFEFGWSGGTITDVKVYFVNAAGDELEALNGNLRPTADNQEDTEYAGSWGQDFANGQISDSGTDIPAGGQSAVVCASSERVHDFQYLAPREAKELVFEVTVSDHGTDFTLEYPKFLAATSLHKVWQETGTTAAQVRASQVGSPSKGPGWRFGQWDWWDGFAVRTTPELRGIGSISTVLDYLCFRNILRGDAPDNDLAATLAGFYDSIEGDTEEDAADRCYSFLLQKDVVGSTEPVGVLVNSWREIPPVMAFPHPARGAQFAATGSGCMTSYSFAQESRFYVHPNQAMHLEFDDAGSRDRWTKDVPGANGWFVTAHKHPVTNDELAADFFIVTDDPATDWANFAPFNGVFASLNPGEEALSGPWNMVDFQGRYHVAQSGTDEIIYRRARQVAPLPSWDVIVTAVSETNARNPRMVQDPKTLRLLLVYESDLGCREIYSDDDGRTWAAPTTMAITGSPEAPTIATGDGGVIRAAVVPGTPNVIGATWQGPGDQTQSAQFTFKDSAAADLEVTDGQFHLTHSGEGNDRWLLEVVIDGETSSSSWWSADNCRTWTRFA